MNKTFDEVYIKVLDEFGSFDTCEFEEMQAVYHRSCNKSYTSKHNCSTFESEEASCLTFNDDRQLSDCCPSVSGVCTRSKMQSFDWSSCIFCCNKTFKKDRKLRKFESDERIKNVLSVAESNDDAFKVEIVSHPSFKLQALYHSDRTVNCCPKYFYQLHTLHGCKNYVPLIYALLPAKDEQCYEVMWKIICDLCRQKRLSFEAEVMHIDFEQAMLNTIMDAFPQWRRLLSFSFG
ncbi:unnamed protein product [Mytilus coruscus]|uniref:MULE transposase domain-containing protein n=1 Tax=Mytilus coruscus TaxID=42192 RepID=A0A6J8DBB9_MYTCO|nr:unnamed protein product [Mytilus coruscus]